MGKFSQHSKNILALRGVLFVIALALGLMSVAGSLARAMVRAEPKAAYQIDRSNGRIAASYAMQVMTVTLESGPRSLATRLAAQALEDEPTAVDAANVLALRAQLQNETELARDYSRYAMSLSRRSFRTHLWAIEEAVDRGDIPSALKHYDLVLRTSKDGAEILMPNLVAAMSEPRIRQALLEVLANEPEWTDAFFQKAASDRRNPVAVKALFAEARAAGLPISIDFQADLVTALFREGKFPEAWELYSSIRDGATRTKVRDPEFILNDAVASPFDWQLQSDHRISVSSFDDRGKSALSFSSPNGTGGTIVSQAQMLPRGSYTLRGRSYGIDQPRGSEPYWALSCHDGRELGRVNLNKSEVNNGIFSGSIAVPENCPVQILSFTLRQSDSIGGNSGGISQIELMPSN